MVVYNANSSTNAILNPENGKHSPIIKIVEERIEAQCTAFVVDNTRAITAAHCLEEPKPSNMMVVTDKDWADSLKNNKFTVYTSKGEKTFITAVPTHVELHADIAILKGNFKDFNKLPLDVSGFNVKELDTIYTCGYAGGIVPPVCNNGDFKGTSPWHGLSNSYIAKGMSGGPVLNKFYKAIGVNSHRTNAGLSTFGILFGNIKVKNE